MSGVAGGVLIHSEHFQALVDALPVALYMTDAAGRITYYNDAAAKLWGRSPNIGKDRWCGSWRLYWADGKPMAHNACPMAQALKTGRPVLGAMAIAERPDGTRFPFIPYPSPIFDADGCVTGAVNMLFDVTALNAAEAAEERRRTERANQLLINEITHRVKNTLGTVQAMAAQTFRQAPLEERNAFVGRLHALAEAHDALTQRDWGNVALSDVTARALHPFADATRRRISSHGADTQLTPNRALLISMVLHELGTNAVKYGALSNDDGTVDVLWDTADGDGKARKLCLTWTERGGPTVSEPGKKGFGSRMIEHAIRGEQGASEFRFAREGLVCRIEMPI